MTTVEVFAPAKINLTLHVTGQRADGYHELDSYVCFAGVGDRISVTPAAKTSVHVTGPFADQVPFGPENLVHRAADLMGVTARISIDKQLPVASGIGGGSADAAATLQALAKLFDQPVPSNAVTLGADVPVCLMGGQVRMRGIGDDLLPLGSGPLDWPMVLVNPGVPVATAQVFAGLARRDNAAMPDDMFDPAYNEFPDWLGHQRNDLEAPAIAVAPVISDVLEALRAEPGCRIARMSGSGATCFALFDDDQQAAEAESTLREAQPNWWVVQG